MSKIAARHSGEKGVRVRSPVLDRPGGAPPRKHSEAARPEGAGSEPGWRVEQVEVVDDDQGQSGTSACGRGGFQWLVSEVALGRVGAVLGLEVSLLARSCVDWYRLLEVAALAQTLIVDEDGRLRPQPLQRPPAARPQGDAERGGASSKWQLFVPSNLAYGTRGAKTGIDPNATLVFEIELLSIQEKGRLAAKQDAAAAKPTPER